MHEKLHHYYRGARPEAPEGGSEGHDEPHFRLHHRPPFGPGPRGYRGGPDRFLWAAGMKRRQQVRRGDVRTAILAVLAEEPMHGYQVMQELGNRSGGAWTPSAGSIYPTLQQLEDEGLVHSQEQDGRRVYSLTDQGRDAAAKASGSAPWDLDAEGDQDARTAFVQLAQAAMQVYQVGDGAQIAEAKRILTNARRELYGLLARDRGTANAGTEPAETPGRGSPTDTSGADTSGADTSGADTSTF